MEGRWDGGDLPVPMAVKRIPDHASDEREQERQMMDLRVVQRAQSPFIIEYYGCDFNDNALEIYMERAACSWYDVRQHVGRCAIPEPVLQTVAHGVIQGLDYLHHDMNVMHRDVKPSNALLGLDGVVKLCDFGMSKQLEGTRARTVVGSQYYFAPERLALQLGPDLDDTYDSRSDIWAVGITLVELAIEYPFDTTSGPYSVHVAITENDPPRLAATGEGEEGGVVFSEEFAHFVACCLQKDCNDRPGYRDTPMNQNGLPPLTKHPFVLEASCPPEELLGWYHRAL